MKNRILLLCSFLAFFVTATMSPASALSDGKAIAFLQKMAIEVTGVQRIGTRSAFRGVINKYADLPTIALYSLGRYRNRLSKGRRSRYFRGVSAFMGRYFANESKRYRLAKTQIDKNVRRDGNDTLVKTKLIMTSGAYYTVVWRLAKRKRGYKITDVKVLGFSLAYLQRGQFSSYIRKHNGNVEALIKALNRHY